ncbi:MAG: PAS domain S-box protein [Verrucomicrobiota bacterium]
MALAINKKICLPVIFVSLAAQFVWDMNAPNGLTDWVWYFIPVYLSIYVGGRLFSYLLATLISLLILIGFYCSPQGIDPQIALIGRLMGIAVIWLMSVIIAHYKNAEKERQRIERALRTTTACNSVLVRATAEPALLHEICRIAVEQGGYRMAWVGFALNDANKTVQVAACAGGEEGYLEKAKITWSDQDERGRGPTGLAIRTGETVVCNDFQNDERTAPWRAEGRQRGYFSSITIPLVNNQQNFGVFVLYAGRRNAFPADEVRLLNELADDLAHGISALRTRAERQAAVLAVEESRSRLALSAEATGLGLWEWNVLTNKIRWDAQMFRLYGIGPTPDGFVEYGVWRNAVLPEELAAQEALLQATARRGGTGNRTFHIRRANDGECRLLEAVETVRKNAGGEVELVFGTNLDITERTQAAEALQTAQARLQFLLTNTPTIIYSLRTAPQLEVTFISPNVVEILGHAPEKFTGDADFWFSHLHPEDAANLAKGFYADAASTAGVVSREYRFRHADGSYRWMRDEMRVIRAGNERAQQFVGHWFDVTGQKQAEELQRKSELQFESLFAQHKACKLLVEPDTGRIRNANAAAAAFYGWSIAQLKQMRIQDINLLPASEVIGKMDAAKNASATRFEFRHRLAAGSVRDVEVFSTAIEAHGEKLLYSIVFDITARKQAEVALQESEARMRDIVFAMADWVWETDENGRYTYSSERGNEWFGSVLGKTPFDFMPPDEAKRRAPIFFKLAASKSPLKDLENWSNRKDGRRICLLTNGVPILDPAGNLKGYRGVDKDVTEAKKAAADLDAQRRFLFDLVENSMLQIFAKDLEGRYLMVNGAFEATSKRKREATLGRTDVEVFGEADGRRFRENDLEVISSGKSRVLEEELTGEGGQKRTFISSKFPVRNERGEVSGIAAMILEITDRIQAEAQAMRLATAVEQSGETIVITDIEGRILYANPAFEKSTGYTRAEALGQNPRLLKSGRLEPSFYRQMWETLGRGETWKGHFINQRKDGTLYEEDATISPIRDAAGKIVNYVAVKRDVTHEVELEGQLRQSQKMEAIGTLAGGIAHDFNNILNIIFGYSNLLQMDLAGKKDALEKVREILKAGERAKDLVQQILMFSRQQEQERQVVHLNNVVKETTKLLRASLPANLEIETELAADAPAVLADATQIYQVIMNLGTNALHAMEQQASGRLKIALDAFQPDAAFLQAQPKMRAIKYARLTVADTRCGMDAMTLARIYDPFFTTKPVGKGTGLGMAVVHGIVESHDGVITVESQPGRGTTFRIYLPEQIQDLVQDAAPEDFVPYGQGQKVLMVDDETVLVGMYQRMFKALKYEGMIVTNPEEAVRLVREDPAQFDLVITDLTMPKLSGFEVARQIREIRADMPVVLATGFHGTVSDAQLADAGICEVVEKPISMTTLALVLRGILGKKPEI